MYTYKIPNTPQAVQFNKRVIKSIVVKPQVRISVFNRVLSPLWHLSSKKS